MTDQTYVLCSSNWRLMKGSVRASVHADVAVVTSWRGANSVYVLAVTVR